MKKQKNQIQKKKEKESNHKRQARKTKKIQEQKITKKNQGKQRKAKKPKKNQSESISKHHSAVGSYYKKVVEAKPGTYCDEQRAL